MLRKPKRNGYKWTINETLSLQRNSDLLKMTVGELAKKHERSEDAILYKLDEINKYEDEYKNIIEYTLRLPKGSNCIFSGLK